MYKKRGINIKNDEERKMPRRRPGFAALLCCYIIIVALSFAGRKNAAPLYLPQAVRPGGKKCGSGSRPAPGHRIFRPEIVKTKKVTADQA